MHPIDMTYADMIVTALTRHSERAAFVQDSQAISYAAARDLVARIVRVFHGSGVMNGKTVAVLAPPRAESWLAMAATHLSGASFSALHPLASLDDHAFVCDDAEVHTLVADMEAHGERATQLLERCPSIRQLLSLGPSTDAVDLLDAAVSGDAAQLATDVRPDDLCMLIYTGGTTGRAKGVMLSQRAAAMMALNALAEYEIPTRPRYLAASPISHAAGIPMVAVLLRGGTVHLHRRFEPDLFLRSIQSEAISMCFAVPTMVYALLDHPELDAIDLASLETILYAGSPIAPNRLEEALDRIGPHFTQFYSQSECAAGTVLTKTAHDPRVPGRLASCGKPVVYARLSLRSADGREAPCGEAGEICLRSPCVMDGYWRQPDLTVDALRDGWLHTGDMAVRDELGYVTIVDRKKDMVVSGGFNVYPREVEDVLTAHPAVAAAAVIGVPDPKWGEAVKAVVVLRPNAPATDRELIAWVRDRKGALCAPKSVDWADSIPTTPVGKPDKAALRARYWSAEDRSVH